MTSWQTKEAGASNALLARLAEMHGRQGREETAKALAEQWRENQAHIAATTPAPAPWRRVKKEPRRSVIIVEKPNQKVMAALTRVASAFFTSPDAILRDVKTPKAILARYVGYYVLHHRFGYSLARTGRLMDRHYSSVINGIERLEARMRENEALRTKVEGLLK